MGNLARGFMKCCVVSRPLMLLTRPEMLAGTVSALVLACTVWPAWW